MDAWLVRIGAQVQNMAIRSAIGITSAFVIQQGSRLAVNVVGSKSLRRELRALQGILSCKLSIVSRAIEVIELKSARGNVFLEGAMPLAKSLHRDIVRLGRRLEKAAAAEENSKRFRGLGSRVAGAHDTELGLLIDDIKALLERLDRDAPHLHLAITCSGENLQSTATGISPSRLMQASALLVCGNSQFVFERGRPAQIGPSFRLSLYMLLLGHTSHGEQEKPYGLGDGERKPLWQEVIHKSRVRVVRTPLNCTFDQERGYCPEKESFPGGDDETARHHDYYHYELELVQDLDDGRAHDDDEMQGAGPFADVALAGIRESIPVHQISKMFYADTGRILNIGNDADSNPVLLIKRDISAIPPAQISDQWLEEWNSDKESNDTTDGDTTAGDTTDEEAALARQIREESEAVEYCHRWRPPKHIDPEWLALEVFTEDDDESSVDEEVVENEVVKEEVAKEGVVDRSPVGVGSTASSLSMLEMLVRLMNVEMVQQTTHLAVPDHITTFFLEEKQY